MKLQEVRRGQWLILATCTDRGECPLLEFLTHLEGNLVKDGRRMLKLLDRVAHHGPPRNTAVSHQVGPGLWEFIQGRLRILWFYDDGKLVICSHGFIKKSQKTPRAEIHQALADQRRYREAKSQSKLEIRG